MEANNKKFSLRKLLYNTKFMVFFSLFASIVFWLAININESPITEVKISNVPITLSTSGTAVAELGLDVVGDALEQTVSVTVSGPRYIVSTLSADDILVTASLSSVTAAGTYELELSATRNSSKMGYSIVSVAPSTITVTFDNIDTKQFTVVAEAIGASAGNGLIADTPVVTENENLTIEISGPRAQMQKISTVVARAAVDRVLAKTESFDAQIILLDEAGSELDQSVYTLGVQTIRITVPISKSAELPIVPTFLNAPADYPGFSLPYSLSVSEVTVIGPPETIDTLEHIQLAAIDFDSISLNSASFEAALDLPSSVRTLSEIETVTVAFDLTGMRENVFNVSRFTTINVEENMQVTINSRALRGIRVCGPADVMNRLGSSDFYAELDMKGKTTEGEMTVTVRIKCDASGAVWQVGSYSVIATLTRTG